MPSKTDRSARIAAAVERSKTEYQSQHAYTERDEAHASWPAEASSSKYALEYAGTRAFGRDSAAQRVAEPNGQDGAQDDGLATMDLVWANINKAEPHGGISREVLDTATRLAVRRGDARAGELADLSKSLWKAPNVGIALGAAEAYTLVGRHRAIEPLLQASIAGLHYPILNHLSGSLAVLHDTDALDATPSEQVRAFRALVDAQRDRTKWTYDLFPSASTSESLDASDDQNSGSLYGSGTDHDPRDDSTLSKLADIQIGTSTTTEGLDVASAPSTPRADPANALTEPASDTRSAGADTAELDPVELAAALGVSEDLVRSVLARLRKHQGMGAQEGEEGKDRAERGVREL